MSIIEWDWNKGVENYFDFLTRAMEFILPYFYKRPKDKRADYYYHHIDICQLTDKLQNGELNTGYFVRIKGIYSEFISILNISLLFPSITPPRPANGFTTYLRVPLVDLPEFSLPLKLKPIRGIGLAGLFIKGSKDVYDDCVPVFYDQSLFELQKGITGHIAEISAEVINLSERWSKLFAHNQFFRYTIESQNKYAGLFIHKFKLFKVLDKFFTDFWRLDYFPFTDPEEDCYEFYQIEPDYKEWPRASKNIINYLSLLQSEGFRRKQIMFFGILPRINLVNPNIVHAKRNHLKDFYSYIYKKAKGSYSHNIIPVFNFGHGAFDLNNFKKAVTVFQHDQVNPVLVQEFNFYDI
jgi:hypothetical protein